MLMKQDTDSFVTMFKINSQIPACHVSHQISKHTQFTKQLKLDELANNYRTAIKIIMT